MPQRSNWKRVIGSIALAVPAWIMGCQTSNPSTDAEIKITADVSRVSIRPIEPRIDALAGRRVLIPVQLTPPTTPAGAVDIGVSIGGTQPIGGELFWISAAPTGSRALEDQYSAWIEAPQRWSARSPEQLIGGEAPRGDGFWALLIDPPRNAHNRALFIDGREAPVQWLEQPSESARDRGVGADLFQEVSPSLQRTVANSGGDPLNRWRTRLLNDRLRGPRRSVIDSHDVWFEHDAIETMALQAEWRWRLALDRLSRIDPFLGAELLDRLTAIARFEEQVLAPVWPADDAALNTLRTTLLDPALSDELKIAMTRDTLRQSPSATAWIIDDAGWVEPTTQRTIILLGVVERVGSAGLVRGSIGSRSGPSVPLPSFGVARAAIQAPAIRPDAALAPTPATLNIIGRDSIEFPTLPVGLPVEPPGFRLGPGFATWTLEHWSAGAAVRAPRHLSFFALLHKRAPASMDSSNSDRAGWQLHIECPTARGEDLGLVRIFLGPSNAPIATLRIDPAGLQTEEQFSPLERDPVAITMTEDSWIATIDIPLRAIESGGILRLAIERYDQSGRRATWPRPVLPWQSTPGRAALDLSVWNTLTPADGD